MENAGGAGMVSTDLAYNNQEQISFEPVLVKQPIKWCSVSLSDIYGQALITLIQTPDIEEASV